MKKQQTEYVATYEGRIGADRMAAGLPSIPDKLAGDLEEINRHRAENTRLQAGLKAVKDLISFEEWLRVVDDAITPNAPAQQRREEPQNMNTEPTTAPPASPPLPAPPGSAPVCPRCKINAAMQINLSTLNWWCSSCNTYWETNYLNGWNDGLKAAQPNDKLSGGGDKH